MKELNPICIYALLLDPLPRMGWGGRMLVAQKMSGVN